MNLGQNKPLDGLLFSRVSWVEGKVVIGSPIENETHKATLLKRVSNFIESINFLGMNTPNDVFETMVVVDTLEDQQQMVAQKLATNWPRIEGYPVLLEHIHISDQPKHDLEIYNLDLPFKPIDMNGTLFTS